MKVEVIEGGSKRISGISKVKYIRDICDCIDSVIASSFEMIEWP